MKSIELGLIYLQNINIFFRMGSFVSTFWYFLFGGHRRNDIDRDTQTSQWKQSHFIEEKHFQKHYRPISSNCRPWEEYWVAMKVSSNPLPLSHPIDKRKFDFSDPFLCHFASAEVPCKKVKFKVEKVSGKFVHICTHLVSSCLKDIKSFSFDGHWPGLQKVTRILSCCPECGLKARLWELKILLWEQTVGIYHQFQLYPFSNFLCQFNLSKSNWFATGWH